MFLFFNDAIFRFSLDLEERILKQQQEEQRVRPPIIHQYRRRNTKEKKNEKELVRNVTAQRGTTMSGTV